MSLRIGGHERARGVRHHLLPVLAARAGVAVALGRILLGGYPRGFRARGATFAGLRCRCRGRRFRRACGPPDDGTNAAAAPLRSEDRSRDERRDEDPANHRMPFLLHYRVGPLPLTNPLVGLGPRGLLGCTRCERTKSGRIAGHERPTWPRSPLLRARRASGRWTRPARKARPRTSSRRRQQV